MPLSAQADCVDRLRARIEWRLGQLLPDGSASGGTLSLMSCMHCAVLAPGKRVRPLLTMLAMAAAGRDAEAGLDVACAIEMVHTASLILDDLPCMDDAALRRGRPATHRVFGEDVAILAAVALLSKASAVVAGAACIGDALKVRLMLLIAEAAGMHGLSAGQAQDLRDRGIVKDARSIQATNHLKTGILFTAAVEAGAILAEAGGAEHAALLAFAERLGCAFQIQDDLLDRSCSAEHIGKDVGQDGGWRTVVDAMGLRETVRYLRQTVAEAASCLGIFDGAAAPLRYLLRQTFDSVAART